MAQLIMLNKDEVVWQNCSEVEECDDIGYSCSYSPVRIQAYSVSLNYSVLRQMKDILKSSSPIHSVRVEAESEYDVSDGNVEHDEIIFTLDGNGNVQLQAYIHFTDNSRAFIDLEAKRAYEVSEARQ